MALATWPWHSTKIRLVAIDRDMDCFALFSLQLLKTKAYKAYKRTYVNIRMRTRDLRVRIRHQCIDTRKFESSLAQFCSFLLQRHTRWESERRRKGGTRREGLKEKEEWCWGELRLWEGIRTSAAFPPLDVFFLSRCAFSPAGKERGKGAHADRKVSYAAAHALALLFSLVLAFALFLQYRSLQPRISDLHQ
jgi:hypothetical protein